MKNNRQSDLSVPFKPYLLAGGIILVLIILFVLIINKKLPPEIPLYYGLPESEEQLAPSWTLVIPGLVAIIIGLINFLISLLITDGFIKKALSLTSIVLAAFAVITTLKIIFLIASF